MVACGRMLHVFAKCGGLWNRLVFWFCAIFEGKISHRIMQATLDLCAKLKKRVAIKICKLN